MKMRLVPVGLLSLLMACGGARLDVDAGDDQELLLGAVAHLEATLDAGGEATFEWSVLSKPSGPEPALQADGAKLALTAAVAGTYELSVTATGPSAEGSSEVTLTVLPNQPPVAEAGADQIVPVGSQVLLDGRSSLDPDDHDLGLRWQFLELPEGSAASFASPSSRTPVFTADVPGRYLVELAVNDGGFTRTDLVTVVTNRPPVVDAGGDRVAEVGQVVSLDGTASHDPDDDAVTFSWSLQSVPAGSSALIQGPTSPTASFTPDAPGSYLVALSVSDGHVTETTHFTLQAVPVGGIVGSVVYVSPSGDDTHPGTIEQPLATIAAALIKVAEIERVYRIQLAPGTYAEDFGHELVDQDLELLGPASGSATLQAASMLFEVSGTGRLTLQGLSIESSGTALVGRGRHTHLTLDTVTCAARRCIESGRFFSFSGGTVNVRNSRILAEGAPLTGVSGIQAQLNIADTEIIGFTTGISAGLDTKLLLRRSVLENNDTGVHVSLGTSGGTILVEDTVFGGGQVGLLSVATTNVRVRRSSFHEGGTGVEVSGGAVQLEDVSMGQMQSGVLLSTTVNTGELVTVRGARFSGIAGPAIRVNGAKAHLDLGDADRPGDNRLASSLGVAIWDSRPVGATGMITVSDTTLGAPLPAGTHTGPVTSGPMRIVGSGNQILVY